MTSNTEFEALKLNQPEELTVEHPDPPEHHEWEQRGNDLVCTSCQNRHPHSRRRPRPAIDLTNYHLSIVDRGFLRPSGTARINVK